MAIRMNTNISLKERRVFQLGGFKGVDFSSSPLDVAANRATDMANFINEYGVNRKRNGWNEIIRIKDAEGNDLPINGVFPYQNQYYKCIVIHAGKRFFKTTDLEDENLLEDITDSCTYPDAKINEEGLLNEKSQCFNANGKMYITGCGDFLVFGSWDGENYELRRVYNNIDTYVPTTTISIDNDSKLDDSNRSTLDAINVLTNKRKNQLLGVDEASSTFTLDSKMDWQCDIEVEIETYDAEGLLTTIKANNFGGNKFNLMAGDSQIGSIDFANNKISFSINTKPQIADRDNIFVTFRSTVEGYEDRITNCSFGILFGTNGGSNRLFLSGNKDLPNYDFYSEINDFTYFSDLNYAILGSSAYPIKSYARLSDSTLAIFKEDNSQEATVYFRTGADNDYYDTDGNLIQTTTIFPTTAGSIGEGVVSRHATANLSGDVLILSPNGVFAIILGDNVSTLERYAKERSRYINERLKQHENLSNAVGIVHKNRYYLSLDNVCYVADARFASQADGDMGDTFNYEWWYWTNIPACMWFTLNDELYFGTKNGQICKFDNEFSDRSYYKTSSGQLSLNSGNNNITYGGFEINLRENDIIVFENAELYELVLNNVVDPSGDYPYMTAIDDGRIQIGIKYIGKFYNGMEVYADYVGSSGLELDTKYTVVDMDAGRHAFALLKEDGERIYIKTSGFRLLRKISGKQMFITNPTESSFQLKHSTTSEAIRLINYNNIAPIDLLARVVLKHNVVAEWYSPVMDLGTNEYSKTLLSVTISTDPSTNGALEFGYETRNIDKFHQARGMRTFSFENFDFNNFSFETAFANSYTKKVLVRNFNYIMFKFRSDNSANCIINNFTVRYKINKTNKGVR